MTKYIKEIMGNLILKAFINWLEDWSCFFNFLITDSRRELNLPFMVVKNTLISEAHISRPKNTGMKT